MVKCLTFNTWSFFYVLWWVKYWFMRLMNHWILFLLTFYTASGTGTDLFKVKPINRTLWSPFPTSVTLVPLKQKCKTNITTFYFSSLFWTSSRPFRKQRCRAETLTFFPDLNVLVFKQICTETREKEQQKLSDWFSNAQTILFKAQTPNCNNVDIWTSKRLFEKYQTRHQRGTRADVQTVETFLSINKHLFWSFSD